MIDDLKNKLFKYAGESNKHIREMSFILAFSGGVDSMVLAHMLVKLRQEFNFLLAFVHINHNANNMCKKMENIVYDFSKVNDVMLYVEEVFISTFENFESVARLKRYDIIKRIMDDNDIDHAFTAHHENDQLETIMMKIEDGSDWISKIGIRESLGRIRRPILYCSKKEILNYASNHNLVWIEDPTNKDISIRRNNLRLNKLPLLLKKYNFKSNILNIARRNLIRFNSSMHNIKSQKNKLILNYDDYSIVIDKIQLTRYSIEEMKLFLSHFILKLFKIKMNNKKKSFWIEFSNFVNYAKSSSLFYLDNLVVAINRQELIVMKDFEKLNSHNKFQLKDSTQWHLTKFDIAKADVFESSLNKNIMILPAETYRSGLVVRSWCKGDKMIAYKSKETIILSDLFINNKLSIIDKMTQPVILNSQNEIIWVPGLLHGEISLSTSSTYRKLEWIK